MSAGDTPEPVITLDFQRIFEGSLTTALAAISPTLSLFWRSVVRGSHRVVAMIAEPAYALARSMRAARPRKVFFCTPKTKRRSG